MSQPPGASPPQSAPPGWYPDPLRRFALRYFNGERWTADVSTDGQRFVDPYTPGAAAPAFAAGTAQQWSGSAGPPRPRTGKAIASMILAIGGLAVAWMPFLFVLGLASAGTAIGLGIAGLRASRRQGGAGRSFAVAGLTIAPVAVALSVVGVVFTVIFVDRVREYTEVGPYNVDLTSCEPGDSGVVTVAGTVENLSRRDRSYVVQVRIDRAGTDNVLATGNAEIDDVAAGDTAQWQSSIPAASGDVECTIADVTGPFPFGLDISNT